MEGGRGSDEGRSGALQHASPSTQTTINFPLERGSPMTVGEGMGARPRKVLT